MLARYPHLFHQPIPGDARSQDFRESCEKTAVQQFAKWESRIAESSEAAVCLDGLCAEQRKQLAALLLDTIVDMQMCAAYRRSSQWARHVRKEAAARLRMLNRKLQNARRAVEKLQAYAQDSENQNPDELHWARQLLGNDYRLAADKALETLAMKCPPTVQDFAEIADEHPTPERVEAVGMVQLYWFYRHGCNLTGHESEVRTAILRNAFWTEYGAEEVVYIKEYDGEQSQGCGAVHQAVTRYMG
jgi:hypothetical protein